MAAPIGTDAVLAKSYTYVRVSMVGVLALLAAAVGRQIAADGEILTSISAYYYTPAQAVFVASLFSFGVCMLALQGTTRTEDVLLNLGGMLATVVALVPTSRGVDHEEAVAACRAAGGYVDGIDCPSVGALEQTAEANIANNVWALLAVGGLGLVVAFVLAGKPWAERSRTYRLGYGAAWLLYLFGLVSFAFFRQGFIDRAHWVAAVGLFLCIVAVAVSNALRVAEHRPAPEAGLLERGRTALRVGLSPRQRYPAIALAMVGVGVVEGLLVLTDVLTLFWLEASLIALFAVFWIAQTAEWWRYRLPGPGEELPPVSPPAGPPAGAASRRARR
ncbi:hypothetical protein [Blastococcus sp. URHD0036]|uniref:hypothetical protein n=1 Tax=Blastococcus sp. URHD0036 TaxID=1380356 RepID=UPI000496F040|nr:hypothetical protein [Blastococcus sp. URHD0036]